MGIITEELQEPEKGKGLIAKATIRYEYVATLVTLQCGK